MRLSLKRAGGRGGRVSHGTLSKAEVGCVRTEDSPVPRENGGQRDHFNLRNRKGFLEPYRILVGKDEEMWARASTAEGKTGLWSSTWSPDPTPLTSQVSSISYHERLTKSADTCSPALISTNSLLSLLPKFKAPWTLSLYERQATPGAQLQCCVRVFARAVPSP